MAGRRSILLAAVVAALAMPSTAWAASLYSGPGSRPGPDILYSRPATAPQLTNAGVWRAVPILVSGTTAYRRGEFLYQDFLYDDHGADSGFYDPNDPRGTNDFSKPSGTYSYPTGPGYQENAADLVELRVRPLADSTAFRLTLNTLKDPRLVAFTIALGGKQGGAKHAFPHGANVRAPARLFLTVHPQGSKLVGELVRATDLKPVGGPAPTVALAKTRRQIDVRIAHSAWNPHHARVRMAAGVGLWDAAAGRYLLPESSSDSTHPGGSGGNPNPAAFFNIAFRTREPMQTPQEGIAVVTNAAWWRDRHQGNYLRGNDISRAYARVDFGLLASGENDERNVPRHGPMDRILASHFELSQGADFSEACITAQSTCNGQYRGRLQPYAIYVPNKPRPARGYGLTLLLHSLSAMYNQYLGTRNQSQFGERAGGSIVITPEARGPDEFYENYGAADVFDVWADVARRYRLDPAWTVITGYSMGGIGTFKLGAQFPDLFARAQPTVGDESSNEVLASLRNVPVLMWNNHGDELVNEEGFENTASALDSLGYRYELDAFKPCSHPSCSPLFANHLQLAINDQFAPAAAFLGPARVNRNPAHVTYVLFPERNHANLGVVGNHAYWVSGLTLRDKSQSSGQVDVVSHGFGVGDPAASPTKLGTGTLTGGHLGPLLFTRQLRTWGAAPKRPVANQLDIDATNIRTMTVDVKRARVNCGAKVKATTDGPLTVVLRGCARAVRAG
jgi:hypothetical protein